LPEPLHTKVLDAFAGALDDVFLWAVPVVLLALVVSFFIKEVPLRERAAPAAPTEQPVDSPDDALTF